MNANLVEVVIPRPEQTFEREAQGALAQAEAYVIDSPAMYEAAGDDLKAIKARYKEIDDARRRITVPLDQAKRQAMDFFRAPLDWLQRAEAVLKARMVTYVKAEEKKRQEAAAAAREAARREQERLERLAAQAEKKGRDERADALREQAAMIPATVIAPPPPPKAEGISVSTRWDFRVTDESAIPREYLVVDMVKIRGVVRAMKAQTRIAGVEVFEVQDIAARRS